MLVDANLCQLVLYIYFVVLLVIFEKNVVCRLYPQGGFTNYLHSNPFANHPNGINIPENFHFVGAATNQSSMSPIDLGATRTHSSAEEDDDLVHDAVEDVGGEETETINVDDDSRTDRRLNWTVEEDKRLVRSLSHFYFETNTQVHVNAIH